MEEFVAKEPLILFEIRKALSEGRVLPEAIEGWWENINPSNAEKRPLVTGESVGKDRLRLSASSRFLAPTTRRTLGVRLGNARTTFGTITWAKQCLADTSTSARSNICDTDLTG